MNGFLDSNLSRVVSASIIAGVSLVAALVCTSVCIISSVGVTACVCIATSVGVTTGICIISSVGVTTGVSIVTATSVIAAALVCTSLGIVAATSVIAAALVCTSLGIVAATSVVTTSIITATSNNSHIVSFTTTRGITLLHGATQQVNADLITNVRYSNTLLHLICTRERNLSGEVTVSICLDVQPHTSAVTLLTLKGSVLRRSQGTTIELNSDHRTAGTILSLETLTTDLQRLTNLPLLRNVHLGTIIVGVNIYFTNYVIAALVGVSLVTALVRVGLVATLVRVGLVATLVRVGLVATSIITSVVAALVVINRGGGGSTTVRLLACARRLASTLNLKGDGVHNNQRTGVLAISKELTARERHITDNIELTGGGLQIDSLHHCTSLQVNNSHIAVA